MEPYDNKGEIKPKDSSLTGAAHPHRDKFPYDV
jgi:hypothetical protein